jgi:hypothetical protein
MAIGVPFTPRLTTRRPPEYCEYAIVSVPIRARSHWISSRCVTAVPPASVPSSLVIVQPVSRLLPASTPV